jgi:Ca2+-binding EF-hand superfamily protein
MFKGLINVEIFKKAMMSMGEPLTDIELNEMLNDLPVDDDG